MLFPSSRRWQKSAGLNGQMEKNVSGLFVLYSSFRFNAPDGGVDPKPTEISGGLEPSGTTAPPQQHCSMLGAMPCSRQQKRLLGCWAWVCSRSHASPSMGHTFPVVKREIVHDISTEIATRNAAASSLSFVHKIWETGIAVFDSITDLLLKKSPLRFTPWVPKRLIPTNRACVLARAEWRTCIYRGTLAKKRK